jgi:hypothetical protein
MNQLLLMLTMLWLPNSSFRPKASPLSAELQAFSYMLGNWEGSGNCIVDNQLFQVKRQLHIYPEKQGRQLKIISLTLEDEPLNIESRVIQQQQHVITFNTQTKSYTIKTHSNHQLAGQAKLEIPFKGFYTWQTGQAEEHTRFQVRYEGGKWIEITETLNFKTGWVQIAALELEKKS